MVRDLSFLVMLKRKGAKALIQQDWLHRKRELGEGPNDHWTDAGQQDSSCSNSSEDQALIKGKYTYHCLFCCFCLCGLPNLSRLDTLLASSGEYPPYAHWWILSASRGITAPTSSIICPASAQIVLSLNVNVLCPLAEHTRTLPSDLPHPHCELAKRRCAV